MASINNDISSLEEGRVTIDEQELREMFAKFQNGQTDIMKDIVTSNLYLVRKIVKYFNVINSLKEDIFQIGCIGLIQAVLKFNLTLNIKFSTFAYTRILGEIRDYFRNGYLSIGGTSALTQIANKVRKETKAYENRWGKEPTIDELSEILKIPANRIIDALKHINEVVSLNEILSIETDLNIGVGLPLEEIIKIEDRQFAKLETTELVDKAIACLTPREKEVVLKIFFHGVSQVDIAVELGVSEGRISQIRKEALTKMRNHISR